jgi:NAD(P)-dependent dehydrogenase (short-subunit alcohol dehydrogenase family)
MNKTAIVTGASKGIGLSAAKMLRDNGYTVYGLSRSPVSEEGIYGILCDVTDTESVKNAVKTVIEKSGRIDLLINNAGMGISGAVENTSEEDAKYIFEVNYFGAFRMIRECIPHLRQSKGRIINISSVAASLCIPFQAFYSSTKAAVDALAFALIPELKPFGIKITNILPGDTKTNFTSSRKKSQTVLDTVYGDRIERSVAVMEKDEQHGMPAEAVAKVILKTALKKNPPVYKAVGFKYKLFMFLNKILPKKLVIRVIGKIYGF